MRATISQMTNGVGYSRRCVYAYNVIRGNTVNTQRNPFVCCVCISLTFRTRTTFQKEVEVQPILHCSDMFATGTYFVLVLSAMGTSGTLNVDDSDQFFANILKEHNEYRKMHDSTPLYLNRFTIDKAKKTLLEWMKNTTVVPNQPGVNTFSVELSEDLQLNAELAKKIVDTWYTTGEGYNYDVEPSKPNNADPFTQVVWKNSHQFGAALNVGEDRLYVVACYIPKGNQPNEYVSNVPKLK